MKLQMTTARLHNLQTIKRIIEENNLLDADIWGYGINSISDGKEEFSSIDVEAVKRTGGLNKHHESFRKLHLLTYKIENNALFVSTFSIDSCSVGVDCNVIRDTV